MAAITVMADRAEPARRPRPRAGTALALALILIASWMAPARAHGPENPAPPRPAGGRWLEPVAVRAERLPLRLETIGTPPVEQVGPVQVVRLPDGMLPFALAHDGRHLWITLEGPWVARFDPASGELARIALPEGTAAYTLRAAPDGSIWVGDFEFSGRERPRAVYRLLPQQGVIERYPLPEGRDAVTDFAFLDGAVWMANYQGGGLFRLDPSAGTLARVVTDPPADAASGAVMHGAFRLLVADGALWATEPLWNRIVRIGSGGEVAAFPLPVEGPVALAPDPAGGLWVTEHAGDRVVHWDSREGARRQVAVWPAAPGEYPLTGPNEVVAGSDGRLWVVVHFAGRLAWFDPRDPVPTVNEIDLPALLRASAQQVLTLWGAPDPDGGLWSAAYGQRALLRVPPDLPGARVTVTPDHVRLAIGGSASVQVAAQGASGGQAGAAGLPEGVGAEPAGDGSIRLTASRDAAAGEVDARAGVQSGAWRAHTTLHLAVERRAPAGTILAVAAGALILLGLGATLLVLRRRR